jgi:hypothetical protein
VSNPKDTPAARRAATPAPTAAPSRFHNHSLADLIDALGKLREQKRDDEAPLRDEIAARLHAAGTTSAKGKEFRADLKQVTKTRLDLESLREDFGDKLDPYRVTATSPCLYVKRRG